MIVIVSKHRATVGLAVSSLALLTACGGGGGGPVVVSTDTVPVLAAGGDDFASSTAAFPYYFADVDLDRDAIRGVASIRVIDAETLELVDPETGRTFHLVLNSGTLANGTFDFVTEGPDGIIGTVDDETSGVSSFGTNQDYSSNGAHFSLFLINDQVDENGPLRERVGGFGFETDPSDMPKTDFGNFTGGEATMYVVSNDAGPDDAYYIVFGGEFELTANFGEGTFDGSVFASGDVNLDDEGGLDEIRMRILTEGTISGSKMDGTLSADFAEFSLAGTEGSISADLALTNSDFDGQFFGTDAKTVTGTFGADFSVTDGTTTFTGETTGFVIAEDD